MATDNVISFARGAPSLDIVATDDLRAAAEAAFANDPIGTFSYGNAYGYAPLREWIAAKHSVAIEQVLVTNGSMQADAFLFDLLVAEGDEVVVEAPTYDRTLLSLQNHGAKITAVALNEDGVNTDLLEEVLQQTKPKLAHIIPNFHNPAGCTLSGAKREMLLDLAGANKFVIFEDDPYGELRFTGEDEATILSLDSSGNSVVYASSFSKTVCPGIRVGYLVGPAKLITQVSKLATETYISPNMVAQSIVYQFCSSGAIERSIEIVKQALRQRCDVLCDELEKQVPQARFIKPQGGYFLWVELEGSADVAELSKKAADAGVVFVKGTDFLLSGGNNCLRLAYSGVTPDQIREGVSRLAPILNS